MGEHDQLFKRAFRLPANAAGELASVLPADVLADLDLASLEALPGDYVDQRLRERFADALFRARFRGTPGYVFFLLEHQSTSDRWMPLRVLEEMARIWREILRHEPDRTSLPPILCVIVHHSESGWTGPRRMQELLDGAAPGGAFARYLPEVELLIDDLGQQSDAALAERPLEPFPKLVLWALRDARVSTRLDAHGGAWAGEVGQLATVSPEDFATLLRYVMVIAGEVSFEKLRKAIVKAVPASEAAMTTVGERLLEEGARRGHAASKAEGLAAGKAEGLAAGKAEGILAILETRGLVVSADQRASIFACADAPTLDRWLRAAVTCGQVDALFAH
jgi:predicted transposase YdaD